MRFKKSFFTLIFFLGAAVVYAQQAATGGSGSQPLSGESANVYTAISTFFNFMDPAQGAAALLNFIATLFYNGLLWVYGFIGTFLIPIPDFSSTNTFLNGSSMIVNNIYDIFACLGVYVCLCGLAINAAVLSSGLGKGQMSFAVVIRSVVAIAFIWAWPMIFSFCANVFTATGYLIFGQNSVSTSGIFTALNEMGNPSIAPTAPGLTSNAVGQNNVPANGTTVTTAFESFWGVAYRVCLVLGLVGLMMGSWALARGDPNAVKIIFGALFGLLIVTSAETLVTNFLSASSGLTQSGQINGAQAIGYGRFNLPPGAGGGGTSAGFGTVVGSMTNGTLTAVSALLKIIISIWGLVICIGVIFAKFLQIGTLLIIFCLGPVLAGFLSHPSTESIAYNGFKIMLKNMINSVIWALALVILYLITNINFGAQTLGLNNLMTSFAVLAGLELIKDSEKFAGLFANGFTAGQGHSTWGNFASGAGGMLMGAAGGVSTLTNLAATAAGVSQGATAASAPMQLAGAAVGAMVPFLGVAGGAKLGQAGHNLINTVNRLSNNQGSGGQGSPTGQPGGGSAPSMDLSQTNNLLRQGLNQQGSNQSPTPTPPPTTFNDNLPPSGPGK